MSILTIIPARSGSKRLPGKNWEKVGGKTLVDRAIHCGNDAMVDVRRDQVFVVTDKPLAPAVCCIGGPARYVAEPEELATDDASMASVVAWFCAKLAAVERPTDAVMLLQPTSPLRTVGDVLSCRSIFERSGCDSVVSVTYDLATKGYRRNGAIYLTRWELAARGELMAGWTQFYVMPPERSIDINTAEDLAEARRIAGDS